MGKFDGVLICSDFDRTLVLDNQTITKENSEAIKYFQDNGGLFTVVSGRFPKYFDPYLCYFKPNTYMGCGNGALIFNPFEDKFVYINGLNKDRFIKTAKEIYDTIPEAYEIQLMCIDGEIKRHTRDMGDFSDFVRNCDKYILKSILPTDEDKSKALVDILKDRFLGEYNVFRSSGRLSEILEKPNDKGDSLLKIKELLKDRVDTVIAVGDFENDIAMLKNADIGYAVDNALDEVKAAADRVTVRFDENAIAKIIYEI